MQAARRSRHARRLGQTNGRDFYEGELAERIAAYSRECGGGMTAQDLRDYRPEWVKPITKRYRGYDLHEIPPNGQGIAALIALGILDRFDLGGLPVDSADSQHLQIEAMKLALPISTNTWPTRARWKSRQSRCSTTRTSMHAPSSSTWARRCRPSACRAPAARCT
ncbi:gamma-glutamyltransferase [Ralstonia sp. 1B3]